MCIHPLHPTRRFGGIEILPTVRLDHPAYRQLLTAAATTGRCPVWIVGRGMESIHPHQEPELALADLDTRVAEDVLRQRWPGRCGCPNDCMAPFDDQFPGILPRPPVEYTAAIECAVAAASTSGAAGDLAVVPVRRLADIPAATRWTGPINSWKDPVGLSAVLRSWEDRFGAVLFRMNLATLELAVAAPPHEEEACLRVAAEHIAFCWDAFETFTGQFSWDTLRVYARRLQDSGLWRFWWD